MTTDRHAPPRSRQCLTILSLHRTARLRACSKLEHAFVGRKIRRQCRTTPRPLKRPPTTGDLIMQRLILRPFRGWWTRSTIATLSPLLFWTACVPSGDETAKLLPGSGDATTQRPLDVSAAPAVPIPETTPAL